MVLMDGVVLEESSDLEGVTRLADDVVDDGVDAATPIPARMNSPTWAVDDFAEVTLPAPRFDASLLTCRA